MYWETGTLNTKDMDYLSGLITWAHNHNLEFHVTENNIHVKPGDEGKESEYAAIYGAIMNTLLEKRHSGVGTWNLWTVSNAKNFRSGNMMIGLYDKNNKPTKSYFELKRLLENPPKGTR